MSTIEKLSPQEIRQKTVAIQEQSPRLRARDIANQLHISEGEWIAAQVGESAEKQTVRLRNEPVEILQSLEPLGEVMALTRNDYCVHERHGIYIDGQFFTDGAMPIGMFINPDIDLRIFLSHWHSVYFQRTNDRYSLQFFDASGSAVHKIHATEKTNIDALLSLVNNFRAKEQSDTLHTTPYPEKPTPAHDKDIDTNELRERWENMTDVHQFHGLLRSVGVERQQSFRLIGTDFAYRVSNRSARSVLDLAKAQECAIMVFVGNRGCIQIHTGNVERLVEAGNWYNVMDADFNLHLDESGIATTWVTRKPTADGIVTAVEVFDEDSNIIATFFGKRKPGEPELEGWRDIVTKLPAVEETQ